MQSGSANDSLFKENRTPRRKIALADVSSSRETFTKCTSNPSAVARACTSCARSPLLPRPWQQQVRRGVIQHDFDGVCEHSEFREEPLSELTFRREGVKLAELSRRPRRVRQRTSFWVNAGGSSASGRKGRRLPRGDMNHVSPAHWRRIRPIHAGAPLHDRLGARRRFRSCQRRCDRPDAPGPSLIEPHRAAALPFQTGPRPRR